MEVDQRRTGARADIELPVVLARAHGNQIEAKTRNLGPGGMCVVSGRPLGVDEAFTFALQLDGRAVEGRAHVCREQLPGVYALRFDSLAPDTAAALERLAGG
jgi:hypothetical protein